MRLANRIRFGSAGPVEAKRTGRSRHGRRIDDARRGLTLVELLVTITIMGLVVAVSVPVIKPMLASNKVKSGADVVAGFLAQARNRAVEEGRPVGVTFERILNYEDDGAYPYNGACILMRQVAEPRPLSGFVKDVRVAVDTSGQISFRIWSSSTAQWVGDSNEVDYWNKLVNPGDQIQFDGKGPKYEIQNGFQIDMMADPAPPVYSDQQPALFKVFRKPQQTKVAPTMAPPVALPNGVVVDLDCSGTGQILYDKFGIEEDPSDGNQSWEVVRDNFCANGPSDNKSVTLMFSPTGEVDRVYYSVQDHGANNYIAHEIPTGPIYLNIGIWERAGFWQEDTSKAQNSPQRWYVSNDYLPDEAEPIRNYHDMNNYWVTIFPRTGAVRVNRLSNNSSSRTSSGAIGDSRKFAKSLHGVEAK